MHERLQIPEVQAIAVTGIAKLMVNKKIYDDNVGILMIFFHKFKVIFFNHL